MNITTTENLTINWSAIPSEKSSGTSGFAISRSVEFPTFKIRRLSFSENYEADH